MSYGDGLLDFSVHSLLNRFETSYSGADQSTFCIYYFLILFKQYSEISGQNAIILAVKVSFRAAREKIQKYIYCLSFNMVSFRG